MPPRVAKKPAGKKPSPKTKSATIPPSKPSMEATPIILEEIPSPTQEEKKVPESEEDKVPEEKFAEVEELPYSAANEAEILKIEVEEEASAPVEEDANQSLEAAEKDPEVSAEKKMYSEEASSGAEQELFEEETGIVGVEEPKEGGAGDDGGVDGVSDGDPGGRNADVGDKENEEEDDPSIHMQASLTERKKEKEFEIFIGGLDKKAVEDDLIKVFSVFGEIQSARIAKNPLTKKSKGFAFIRYATIEHAKKALAEYKDGTEIIGKRVGISTSQDKDTLYLGNICKTWTKNHVIETLKSFGVEQIEHISLPDDPKDEGKSRGFALLEFASHSDAREAFQRLRKPDAVFGCDISAKVAFAQTPINPSEEALLQVKTVYVEGLPLSWDEEKVKELCKQYGEIEKVQLPRNSSKKAKRKDFGFVEFTSRENAVACVEGINNAQLGEGEVKVKANLAKPLNKSRLAKQGARGGFKVKKDGEGTEEAGLSKKKSHAKLKEVIGKEKDKGKDKGKVHAKLKNTKASQPLPSEGKGTKVKDGTLDRQKSAQSIKGRKRGGRGVDTVISERPSKKARNNRNVRDRPSSGFGQSNTRFGKPKVNYTTGPSTYASRFPTPASRYPAHAYAGASGSKRSHSDMEPHAGYIPAAKQGRSQHGYEQRRADRYDSQPWSGSGYAGAASVLQTSYPGYSSYAGYEAGYAYPSSGAYAPRGAYY